MIAFWLLATLMAAFAVAAVLVPLLRRRRATAGAADTRLEVYRERYAELDREHARGNLDQAELAEAREELERELLAGMVSPPTASSAEHRLSPTPRTSAIGVALLVPAIALAAYLGTGRPALIGGTPVQGLSSAEVERFSRMPPERRIRELAPLVEHRPEATRAWTLLAQAYRASGRYGDAVDAYARVRAQGVEDPWLLARQAEALLLANGRRFTGSVEGLIQRALELDGSNALALMLAGHAALTRGEGQAAADYWQRLASTLPADSENRAMIERLIARARGESSGTGSGAAQAASGTSSSEGTGATATGDAGSAAGPQLRVRISLGPELADAAPADTPVFVFARAPGAGGGPPLAVSRTTVGALPAELTLTDAQAMMPSRKLSQAEQVVVTARAALNGGVMAKPGDLEGRSDPIEVTRDTPLNVRIDHRIE